VSPSIEKFSSALTAAGPHPQLAHRDQLFAPFIGCWHLRVEWSDAQGHVTRPTDGEWHFAWVLDGGAVQDDRGFRDADTLVLL
jgi:hypothetical protein